MRAPTLFFVLGCLAAPGLAAAGDTASVRWTAAPATVHHGAELKALLEPRRADEAEKAESPRDMAGPERVEPLAAEPLAGGGERLRLPVERWNVLWIRPVAAGPAAPFVTACRTASEAALVEGAVVEATTSAPEK